MNRIICPNCKNEIEISEAIAHKMQEEVLKKAQTQYREQLERQKKEVEEKAEKRIKDQLELKFKDSQNELEETKEQNRQFREQLLEITKQLRFLKQKGEERELEMQKKLLEEADKIALAERKKAEEENRSKVLELRKQLSDVSKANDDLRRKINQGSQQTQGEAFEVEFEKMLKREFPNDQTTEVVKGTKGGDIIQQVLDRNGNTCGKILWEMKNTKTWSELWIDKIKTDQRAAVADYGVLISEAVPETVDSARFYKNIWVTKRNFAIGLASALRLNLIQIAMVKRAVDGKKGKSDLLFSYLSGTEFRLRVEAIIDAFTNMQTEIEKEKRYFSNKWARDEKNIRQVIDNTYGMHGDLKGIVGSTLSQIKGLDPDQVGLSDGRS